MTSNESQKFAAVALGLAAVVGGYLYYRRTRQPTTKKEAPKTKDAKVAQSLPPMSDEILNKVQELKEAGNSAFKAQNFALAIENYTKALEIASTDQHLLFSNRSAAHLVIAQFEEAKNDALSVIKLNPNWSKGYYRLGKVLHAQKVFEEACENYYKALLLEPKSEELQRLFNETRKFLPPFGELDSRNILEFKSLQIFFERELETLCKEVVKKSPKTIETAVKAAIEAKKVEELSMDPDLETAPENQWAMNTAISYFLDKEDDHKNAFIYVEKAIQAKPEEFRALLFASKIGVKMGGDEFEQSLEYAVRATRLNPDSYAASTTLCLCISALLHSQAGLAGQKVESLLEDLRPLLSRPFMYKLLIADCGLRLWFKFFEDLTLQEALVREEQEMQGKPVQEALLFGLTKGTSAKIFKNPFFIQALCEVVFNNPNIEKVLLPLRFCLLSVTLADFSSVSDFSHAIALQCFANNFAWETNPDEDAASDAVIKELNHILNNTPSDQLVVDGKLTSELYLKISQVSLYRPINSIAQLKELLPLIDRSKYSKIFVQLLKTLDDDMKEAEIADHIPSLTPVNDDAFFDSHISPFWISMYRPPVAFSIEEEFNIILPKYKVQSPRNGSDWNVLVAGCRSGREAIEVALKNKNVRVFGVDPSLGNLAYAQRMSQDMGLKVSFGQADVHKLTPAITHQAFKVSEFDYIIGTVYSVLGNPLESWKRLSGLLRKGGLMKLSVHPAKHIELVASIRAFLNERMNGPKFFAVDKTNKLRTQVIKQPTETDLREARKTLLDFLISSQDPNVPFMEIFLSPAFYTLGDFMDLVFDPHMTGLDFITIGKCLQSCGLRFVSWELPNVPQEILLKYKIENDDPTFSNFEAMEKFMQALKISQNELYKTMGDKLTFIVEKM